MRCSLLMFLLLFTFESYTQDFHFNPNLENIAKKYFSVYPEGHTVPDIIQQLKSNVSIFGDTTIERSDSTLFYFRGFTSTFNPFQTTFNKIEFQIREHIFKNIYNEPIDTLLIFQIIGIADSTNLSVETMKKELVHIAKAVSPLFSYQIIRKAPKKYKRVGISYNFYSRPQRFPAMIIGMGRYYLNKSIHTMSIQLSYHIKMQ